MKFLKQLYFITILFSVASCGIFRKSEKETKPVSLKAKYKMYSEKLGFGVDEKCNLKLMEEVVNWLGVPYKFGGETKKGIDCSGLTNAIYKSVYNKTIPRVSLDIYEASDEIKKKHLTEGDLVFFKIERKKVSHVGVYLKDNKFIHSSAQKGVIISDLEEDYYQKTFYKAGRIK